MSDRLAELRRQRELIEQHLAWLEREIAAAERNAPGTKAGGASERIVAPIPVAPSGSGTRAVSVATAAAATVATTVNVVMPNLTAASTSASAAPAASVAADALLDEYRVAPGALKSDVRKGCFLYFALAFVLVGLVVGVLWLAFNK